MCVYAKVSGIISSIRVLRSNFTSPPLQNEPLKSPPRSGLKIILNEKCMTHPRNE